MKDFGHGTLAVGTSSAADLNTYGTAVLTHVFKNPAVVLRYGLIAVTGGILAAGAVNLQRNTLASPSVFTDIDDTEITGADAVRAVGEGVALEFNPIANADGSITMRPGESLAVLPSVPAGGTSTAHVFIEYVDLPNSGDLVSHIEDL